ncbi:methionyl-tRNA formyltransferase [Candidatus Giovannonibacteria bacterium]|nr:methionyl-tRNA formyltransferase [Candidatus Giovannonibacteria bacterium]
MPKIIFFGSSHRAVTALKKIFGHGFRPDVIVTTESPEVEIWSAAHGIKILKPKKLDGTFAKLLAAQKPDVGILASYGKLLSEEVLNIFPKGILNIHPSLLPKYRGPTPEQAVILNGDKITGVSVILLKKEMDAGPILAQEELAVSGQDTLSSLSVKLFDLGSELLLKILPGWIENKLKPKEQDESRATYTKLLKKEDGHIDWSRSAEDIERMVRAFDPWPGTYARYNTPAGGQDTNFRSLKIKKAEIISLPRDECLPGLVFMFEGFPAVCCGGGALKIVALQPEGRKEMSGKAFMLGNSRVAGEVLR